MPMKRILIATTALVALTAAAHAQATTTPNKNTTAPTPPATAQKPSTMPQTSTPTNQAGSGASATTPTTAQTNPGIRTVDPSSVRVTFYSVQAADVLASDLQGLEVRNLQNENVGEIDDFVIDNGKTIKAVILSVGGFLGIGDHRVAVEPGSIVLAMQGDGSYKAVLNTTKEDLKKAPEFKVLDEDEKAKTTGAANGANKASGNK
jgi:hypothetical protein